MIVGLGLDSVDIAAVERALERHGERFRHRVFTLEEQRYCDVAGARSYAARWAAKEAFAKALGTGIAHGLRWVDVEVVRNDLGAPSLRLHGTAAEMLAARGATRMHIAITHTPTVASAVVVIEA